MEIRKLIEHRHIILDIQETWPKELIHTLDQSKALMLSYLEEERRIDEAAEKDVALRINWPINKYQSGWDKSISEIQRIISNYPFSGFHCTRLTENEIRDISENGLIPLSHDLIVLKLNTILEQNFIDSHKYTKCLNSHKTDGSGRLGNVFTFHELRTLKDESGLYRLFRCWGGEYFYWGREDNDWFRKSYFNIGKPTIVLISLNYEDIKKYNIERRVVKNYLYSHRDDFCGNDFDGCHKRGLKVLGCITQDEDLFEELTGYRSWRIY